MAIKGVESEYFLAMNKSGRLYGKVWMQTSLFCTVSEMTRRIAEAQPPEEVCLVLKVSYTFKQRSSLMWSITCTSNKKVHMRYLNHISASRKVLWTWTDANLLCLRSSCTIWKLSIFRCSLLLGVYFIQTNKVKYTLHLFHTSHTRLLCPLIIELKQF